MTALFLFYRDMKPLEWKSETSDEDAARLWKIAEVWTCLNKYKQSLGIPIHNASSSALDSSDALSNNSNSNSNDPSSRNPSDGSSSSEKSKSNDSVT